MVYWDLKRQNPKLKDDLKFLNVFMKLILLVDFENWECKSWLKRTFIINQFIVVLLEEPLLKTAGGLQPLERGMARLHIFCESLSVGECWPQPQEFGFLWEL